MITTRELRQFEFDKKKEKLKTIEKRLGGGFRSGSNFDKNKNAIYRDPRGMYVQKSEASKENQMNQNPKTAGEMMLFGRDFKKSKNVWNPNDPTSKVLKNTLHASIRYVEEGEKPKVKREHLPLWKYDNQTKPNCFEDRSLSTYSSSELDYFIYRFAIFIQLD